MRLRTTRALIASSLAGVVVAAAMLVAQPAASALYAAQTVQQACTDPAWQASAIYVNGDRVSHNGHAWRAKWWTQGEVPGTTGEWGVWADLGPCSGGPPPTTPPPTSPPPTGPPPSGDHKVVGYFAQWGVYARNYHVKNIHTSGSASKLTHIMYAFGNVTNGQCAIGDSYADYDRFYSAAESVDGVADTWDTGALRGSFNQLRKLKQMYPHLKVIWSFGGWTWSGGFGQAAANPTAFASSCYNLVNDPRWAGVFDGIDIDWEYPNACGLSCDSSGFAAYRNLMQALRNRFGNQLVTSAITADGTSGGKIDAADYGGAAQYVNFYMVMTYDFFGAWAATGPTAPHSPLNSYSGIPVPGFYGDAAIQKLKSKGVPASKLLLGVPFYGRGWTGVSQSAPGGSATGPAPGTYEQGIEDYKVLRNGCPATGTVAGTAYARCGSQWWSYDTPATIGGKMNYVEDQGLGGAFFWELSGDTSGGELITAMS
jgi:chitinase